MEPSSALASYLFEVNVSPFAAMYREEVQCDEHGHGRDRPALGRHRRQRGARQQRPPRLVQPAWRPVEPRRASLSVPRPAHSSAAAMHTISATFEPVFAGDSDAGACGAASAEHARHERTACNQ